MTIGKVTNTINGVAHERILLTAAEGKALTNDGGVTVWNCIAVDSADGWTEIDAPGTDEPISDTEALEIITGGTT